MRDASVSTITSVKCLPFQTLRDLQLENMKFAAEQFINSMLQGKSPRWLSFLGSSGAGKTMLAKWIYSVFKDKLDWTINWPASEKTARLNGAGEKVYGQVMRFRGQFVAWSKIARYLREGEYRIFDDICAPFFLVVDDIGAEYGTDFINSKLYELCNRREGKWTIFTANLSLSDIEQRIDTRIASRMIRNGSTVVDVNVSDFNLREKPEAA